MTPERALDYARRMAQHAMDAVDGPPRSPNYYTRTQEAICRAVLPILQEAIAESVEDHLVSVLAPHEWFREP